MTQIQIEEKRKIFRKLKDYADKHEAEFYCIILTPVKGDKVTISQPTNQDISPAAWGESAKIIHEVVMRDVIAPALEGKRIKGVSKRIKGKK